MYVPFDRFVNLELGSIVHEGRYRRDFAIVDDVGSTLVLPKSTKQGEFWFSCIHFQTVTTYLPLDRCIHTDFGNIVCDGRYRRISSSSTMMLLFFLLFGVRPDRDLTYRTNIYVDRAFYIFKVHTVQYIDRTTPF
jgi:hypothetical protein